MVAEGEICYFCPVNRVIMGCGMGDHPDYISPLDDERWSTVMGQEVLADLRQSGYVDDEL